MARLKGVGGASITDEATRQGRMDATAMLSAKMIEALEGNTNPMFEHLQEMMNDPERLGAAALSILNLFWAWATSNGSDVSGVAKIIEWNINQLQQDTVKMRLT